MKGLTGKIKFDQHGLRSKFELEIVELKKDGLIKVGYWTEDLGVNFTRNFTESYTEIVESLQNKTLIVTTIFVSENSECLTPKRKVEITGTSFFFIFRARLILCTGNHQRGFLATTYSKDTPLI